VYMILCNTNKRIHYTRAALSSMLSVRDLLELRGYYFSREDILDCDAITLYLFYMSIYRRGRLVDISVNIDSILCTRS